VKKNGMEKEDGTFAVMTKITKKEFIINNMPVLTINYFKMN